MDRDLLSLTSSLAFVDEVSERFAADPATVDPSWNRLLNGTPKSNGNGGHAPIAQVASPAAIAQAATPAPAAKRARFATSPPRSAADGVAPGLDRAVWALVHAYRSEGHLHAQLDPLGLHDAVPEPELELAYHGITEHDLDHVVDAGIAGMGPAPVRDVLARLRTVYSGSVGLELMHITSHQKRAWLAEQMERRVGVTPKAAVRKRALQMLVNAEGFERFCHVKYPGTKRFSLEGSETSIPLLDLVISHGARLGAIECVIGMAHRGRLTALEQVMQRAAREIFAEFEDVEPEASLGGGDVKYHNGYSCDRSEPTGEQIHLSLAFNPSHLEAVDPVVVGRVRAKQLRHQDWEHRRVMGVLVHGDAAFAGQGLVPEVLNLTSLAGYRTGGTVHVIINNQVGFTASPAEQRSTTYCTDVALMIQCPIWHVNGEDVDAVAQVVEMAMAYRARFRSDVVIDMYCFRKYGHNEMDEPGFTQPVMYERIQKKPPMVEIYSKVLEQAGVIGEGEVAAMIAARTAQLEEELAAAKVTKQRPRHAAGGGLWRGYTGGPVTSSPDVDTGVPRERLEAIGRAISHPPPGFTPHSKIVRLLEQRAQMAEGQRPLDWGMGEVLAYGSLLWEGTNVRLSGQDCARGTFSHRHALIADIKTGAEHSVLSHLHPEQGLARIFDSPLSEAGVLGFEYGFSLDSPDSLVLWEAQFGDFANGAQVIIDQFIVSGEDKWNRLSGIVLLLPHGYEGQGPEHSSARLERFLQLCAEDNIQVAQPTTPAQMFHMLRRQVRRSWRKPLIVMTPKSLLRLPAASSTLDELTSGTFRRVIDDATIADGAAKRVLLCSGKLFYELVEERKTRGDQTTALVRVEELYPWPVDDLTACLQRLGAAAPGVDVAWVQDEPGNMGAATFAAPRLSTLLGRPVRVVARDDSASPATGSHKAHGMEHARLMVGAFGPK
jgi:2-oxoglutarate dehydrogenase E1 component